MKLTCPRESLLAVCQLAGVAVAGKNSTKTILCNLKLTAESDTLTVSATDTEQGVRLLLRGGLAIEESGEAIVSPGQLTEILRKSADDSLTLETDDSSCRVTTSTGEFDMPGFNPDEFPDIPTFTGGRPIETLAGPLREMIHRTSFAAAKEERKYALQGTLWEVNDTQLTLVATDTKRLARAIDKLDKAVPPAEKELAYIVPTKVMLLLEKHLQSLDADTPVHIRLRPNEIMAETEGGRAMVYSRLMEGRFPPYKQIIPSKFTAKAEFTVEPFLAAVNQAAIMSDSQSKRVQFGFANNKLTLSASSSASGRSKVTMPLNYEGPPMDISFDPDNIIDFLKVLDPEGALILELQQPDKAAVFRIGLSYLYVVMPMA